MNGISGAGTGMMQTMFGHNRPDPTQMARKLFTEIDTAGQGYIERSDLAAAYETTTSVISTSSDDSGIDELFSQLDSNDDGKITQQEFTDSFIQLDEQISNIMSQMRANEARGMMPPPPPPSDAQAGEMDEGFTLEQLTAQLEEIGSSDPRRAELISNIIENFDEADTDGDGKVSFAEAMTFDEGRSANGSATTTSETLLSSAESSQDLNQKVMMQLTRLLQAYGADQFSSGESTTSISESV
ncbi:EF-hand domain-containing protein [Candidatus Thiodiazotropha sp. CDECU1]|uniref:EF-hand domain-containing protein n=1 Tax=Candidatus Thiodiazotropha sp. CDECU1 TaxID=3065865 RepID=UPI00292D49EE|nr:EF-hand domain-containing protein [Candidatus Thiodiazotropha sp. CDECU1]